MNWYRERKQRDRRSHRRRRVVSTDIGAMADTISDVVQTEPQLMTPEEAIRELRQVGPEKVIEWIENDRSTHWNEESSEYLRHHWDEVRDHTIETRLEPLKESARRTAAYDRERDEFDPPAKVYFDLRFMEMNLEEDLDHRDPERRERAERVEDNLKRVEDEALQNLEEMIEFNIRTEGHGSHGDLVCKIFIQSMDEMRDLMDAIGQHSYGEGRIDPAPYFQATGWEFLPEGDVNGKSYGIFQPSMGSTGKSFVYWVEENIGSPSDVLSSTRSRSSRRTASGELPRDVEDALRDAYIAVEEAGEAIPDDTYQTFKRFLEETFGLNLR